MQLRPDHASAAISNTQTVYRAILNLLFPPRCVICREAGTWFCTSCQFRIEKINFPFCERCGRPLRTNLCLSCQRIPLQIDGIRAVAFFDGVMRDAIHRFKYQRRTELAPIFADMLTAYLADNPVQTDIVVPVPLFPAHERTRGYNQSLLLANELSIRLRFPVAAGALTRVRATSPQYKLDAAARRENVRGAFVAERLVEGMHVLLLDDVCTTGATMDECSIALRKSGAKSIWGLALAHARYDT